MSRFTKWGLIAVGMLAVAVVIANAYTLGLLGFVLPTGSMEDTLLIGDRFLIYQTSSVQRGDIIAFRYPVDESQTFVKRIVGVPGDRIRLQNKKLILNGITVSEPYAVHKADYVDNFRDNFPATEPQLSLEPTGWLMLSKVKNGEVVVPADNYFVLGDNRDHSSDSRYWGFVPKKNILGKPWLIYIREDEGFAFRKIEGFPLGR
jgi:signal peptidase I